MSNIVSLHSRRALTSRGLTTTTSIVPGSNRASFVDRVLHAARAEKAKFGVGDKVADKRDPSYTGTVHQVLHSDTVRYLVSFSGIRCICDQSALEKAGA
ncbi:MAG TPA: hypothetical protein PLX33_09760 [Alphaproteobacteria bacterium]|nr:hypothetical protein [Alphaproteobacteria bacterium]